MEVNEIVVVLSFLILIIVIFTVLGIRNNLRIKQDIKREWGKIPRRRGSHDSEESLKKVWEIRRRNQNETVAIDDITWHDLDMMELFNLINGTRSSVGSEALYARLRSYELNESSVSELKRLKEYFAAHPKEREEVQYRFAKLGKKDNNYVELYLQEPTNQKLNNAWLYTALGLLPLACILFMFVSLAPGITLFLLSMFVNMGTYFSKKRDLDQELESMRYLVGTVNSLGHLAKISTPVQAELKEGYQKLKGISKAGFAFANKSGSDGEMFMEYFNMLFLVPFISYNYVLYTLQKHREETKKIWRILGDLESSIAVLNFEQILPYSCEPKFTEELAVTGKETYHLLLSEAVPNDVDWQKNTLVTGSNASGKSTYVKSIAINSILAQTIGICGAKEFRLPRAEIYTSMAMEDDLFEGESYFIAEIKSVKRIIDRIGQNKRCLCFIDEILKGTNTIERIASSAGILNWIKGYQALAFVATHDIELPEIMGEACANVHFEEQVTEEEGVAFDYLLRQGRAQTRNAIKLLEVMKYPEQIVDTAEEEASWFDHHRSWRKLTE